MTTSNLNVAHTSDGVSSPDQLSLPVGLVGLVRPRREPAPELPFMAACRETTTVRDGKKLPGSRKVVFLALAWTHCLAGAGAHVLAFSRANHRQGQRAAL